jgi:hypothetical protein
MMLADLGAEVIKVERPGVGDDTRSWGPPWVGDEPSYFLGVNRNKQSRTSCPAPWTASASVSVSVSATSSITGFGGHNNPPGYDLLIQAVGGLMGITGPDAGTPTKVGVAVVDVITGMHAALGILAALRNRDRTGEGQRVEVDLLSSLLSALANQSSGYVAAGVVSQPQWETGTRASRRTSCSPPPTIHWCWPWATTASSRRCARCSGSTDSPPMSATPPRGARGQPRGARQDDQRRPVHRDRRHMVRGALCGEGSLRPTQRRCRRNRAGRKTRSGTGRRDRRRTTRTAAATDRQPDPPQRHTRDLPDGAATARRSVVT